MVVDEALPFADVCNELNIPSIALAEWTET